MPRARLRILSFDPDGPPPAVARARNAQKTKAYGTKVVTPHDRLTFEERRYGANLDHPWKVLQPKTRAECENVQRPCPWVSCRHHLYLNVDEFGKLKLQFPHLDPEEMTDSCALDVAEDGPQTLYQIGPAMNITPENVNKILRLALIKARSRARKFGIE